MFIPSRLDLDSKQSPSSRGLSPAVFQTTTKWPAAEVAAAGVPACSRGMSSSQLASWQRSLPTWSAPGFQLPTQQQQRSAKLDEAVKGTVLSSFFWGYALSQVLCSQLSLLLGYA